ncbi:MAG: hypothetical protein ACC612_11455 [Methanomethylovorans sp.]|uniref:hypothetical protein n=1 Tax=Methanomethylovorans sp. TaxID=2758717 RepID=UPI003530CDF3
MAVLMIQIAFAIVNVTGVFPVAETVPGFNYDEIVSMKDEIAAEAENLDSIIDYTAVLGKLLYLGLKIVLSFIVAVFASVPAILKMFYMPAAIADLIGYGVDVLILLGLGNILLQRSGY